MKSLYIVVEGETELEFVNKILMPYFVSKGLNTFIQGIMVKKGGGGHGYSNIDHFRNTIGPLLKKADQPIITTLLDHYGLNSEQKLPGYSECIALQDVETRIAQMEEKLNDVVQSITPYRFFIPYIQRHEMETLLFSNPEEGFYLEDQKIVNAIVELVAQFDSIEDINCTSQGAPSKRIAKIYSENNKRYNKVADAVDIIELTGIETVIEKCPRFGLWLAKIISVVLIS